MFELGTSAPHADAVNPFLPPDLRRRGCHQPKLRALRKFPITNPREVVVSIVRAPALLVTTLLLLVAFDAQATNGYFSDGFGIKAEGLAGVGIAFPQDSLKIATNPAGLTVPDTGFDVGADVFLPRRSATLD